MTLMSREHFGRKYAEKCEFLFCINSSWY